MMIQKSVLLAFCLSTAAVVAVAQDQPPSRVNTYTDEGSGKGFLKQNLFIGGSLDLGFAADQFNVGINPEVGYSLTRWLDAGLVANFNYVSVSPDPTGYYNSDLSEKEFIYGGGVFARAFFVPFLFAAVQPEYNWTHDVQKYEAYATTYTFKENAASVLVGLGYTHREVGQGTYYLALMVDVGGSKFSPYNDVNGHPLPVIRAGFDIFVHRH